MKTFDLTGGLDSFAYLKLEGYKLTDYHVHQCFHAVGHGTFITGVVVTDHSEPFKWVYDCGSRSSNALHMAITRTGTWPAWKEPINMLALSHFDDDHVNGLEALLAQSRVDCLVLPFSEWQQRVRDVAIGGLKGISASTAQLQLAPTVWLKSKGLESRVGTLLLVRGGASEPGDKLDPILVPTGTNPNELGGDRQPQESHEQRDLQMIAMAHVGGPSVQVVQHGTPIRPDAFPMEFMFYNAELSGTDLGIIKKLTTGELISKKSKRPLQEARDMIEAEISALGLDKTLNTWPKGWRAKLKSCYESHFGSSSTAKNNISLCMYVGPVLEADYLERCQLFQEHNAPPPVIYEDAGSCFHPDRPAVLCTGDLRLDLNVILAMQSHFGKSRWDRIGITQIPHHGSEHSWVPGNAKYFAPSAFVHCAPGKGAHPHPTVDKDLTGQVVFTADYQKSIDFKYHFLRD